MQIPLNFDLLTVGIAIAAIGILGFVVFFNNRRSITNRTFLLFALLTIVYGVSNYAAYQINFPLLTLWLWRLVIFVAVWYSLVLFQLFYVFPKEGTLFPKLYKFGLVPLVAFVSILNLTPLVFSGIGELAPAGQVSKTTVESGIYFFVSLVLFLVVGGIYILFRKMMRAQGVEQIQYRLVWIGTVITYSAIIVFNMILPALFLNVRFIPLAPIFILPFVSFTAYAIIKHHLLNIKVIATEILTFLLTVATAIEIVAARDLATIVLRSVIFLLVLGFGILLIRSVRKEVEQREQLARLNRLKSEFLSFASHQLKAPLAIIKGYSTLIYDGTLGEGSKPIKATAVKMKAIADRLIGLISNYLDWRKIEEGKIQYRFSKLNLATLVVKMVDELEMVAKEKNLELRFTAAPEPIMASVDEERFSQVVQNLIENAIKYTTSGWVKVELAAEPAHALLSVKDSGLGIPKELLQAIFEEFTRDPNLPKQVHGTGLGLYIAREIVKAHRGEIWAESEGEGKGAQFYVRLPLERHTEDHRS